LPSAELSRLLNKTGPGLRPAPLMTRFKRLHRGAQKGDASIWGRCPERAAGKTPMPTLNGQRNLPLQVIRKENANLSKNRDYLFYDGWSGVKANTLKGGQGRAATTVCLWSRHFGAWNEPVARQYKCQDVVVSQGACCAGIVCRSATNSTILRLQRVTWSSNVHIFRSSPAERISMTLPES